MFDDLNPSKVSQMSETRRGPRTETILHTVLKFGVHRTCLREEKRAQILVEK